MVQSKLDLL